MPTSRYFAFEPFWLDVLDERLWDRDRDIRLGRKAFAVLQRLLGQAGQLVTKDDLFAAVWPDTAVSDAALTTVIRELREALGDAGRSPHYIQTVHGRGYRFIAPVVQSDASVLQLAGTPLPSAPGHGGSFAGSGIEAVRSLIGRDNEWDKLHEWYAIAKKGIRRIGFVAGEAGIGKTTLVDAFISDPAVSRTALVAHGQCIELYGAGEPYMPLLEAIGRLGRESDLPIADILRSHAPSWLAHLPSLASERDADAPIAVTPERMLRQLADALDVLTSHVPLILVLEDLHWSDNATLEWLAYAARRRDPAHLLVLSTYRPVEALLHLRPLRNLVAELRRHPQCEELVLDYFPSDSVAAYMGARCGAIPRLEELADVLCRRTGGHPLYLTMIMDELKQRGFLDEAIASPPADLNVIASVMPPSARQFIEYRLEQLSADDQAILEAASVAGDPFLVTAVAAGISAPENEIEARCSAWAREGRFLMSGDTMTWPDGTLAARYRFRHAIHQEVIYSRIAPERRARLQRSIGERLEIAYGAQVALIASELAMLFDYGHEHQKAAAYLELAARGALERSAYFEARRHLTRAVELLQALPESSERSRRELELMLLLGQALKATEGWGADEVERAYARSRDLSRQLDDTAGLLQAIWGLISVAVVRARFETTQTLAREMLELANRLRDSDARIAAEMELGGAAFSLGDPSAREYFQRAEDLCENGRSQSHIVRFGADLGVFSRIWATHLDWYQGYPDRARAKAEDLVRLSKNLSHPFTQAITLAYTAMLHQFRRDLDALDELTRATVAYATEYGFPYYAAWAELMRGWSRAAQTAGEQGIPEILHGIEVVQTTAGLRLPYYLTLLAQAYTWNGQIDEAFQTLDVAWTEIQNTQERWWEAELHRLRGELLQCEKIKRPAEAENCFRTAIAVARDQKAKSLELRTAVSLGRLLRDQGNPTSAYRVLVEVHAWFTEGFDTMDLREARSLLDELSSSRTHTRSAHSAPRPS